MLLTYIIGGGDIMSKRKIEKMGMPVYSKGEELFNVVSHAIGAVIGFGSLILFIILAIKKQLSAGVTIGLIVYSLTIIFLYLASSIYHGINPNTYKKKVARIVDHCTIYVLIAGTYTPIAIMALDSTTCLIILLIEWIGALIGILLNAYDLSSKKVLIIAMFLYLIMGWALILVPNIINILSLEVFLFILIGGIIYTLGVIFYGIGHNKKWFHSIFHIFCVLGTIVQEVGIIILLLNL